MIPGGASRRAAPWGGPFHWWHPGAAWLLAGLGLLLAAVAYLPGLAGPFLFDDYGTLPALGAYGAVDNAATFWRYLTSGYADPTGRPLALASFLLDARDWPADPAPFKRTNLILHLANAALLMLALARLGRLSGRASGQARLAAVLAGLAWALHPLWVSTTLYVVQREAMLPATFFLLALLAWMQAWELIGRGRVHAGALLALLAVSGATLLGTLSKANGLLLPLLLWLVHTVVISPAAPANSPASRRLVQILLGIPSLAVLLLLAAQVPGWIAQTTELRDWSLGQRLLSQPRALLDYLGLLWLPRPLAGGILTDDFAVSRSLLAPASTLPALLAIFALIALAAWQRHRRPALALCIGFFFAGHLMESGPVPLELYYEHRNYLPALLMGWPLALWIAHPATSHGARPLALVALAVLAGMTATRSHLWGDTEQLALHWGQRQPESVRAQAWAAQIESHAGRPGKAWLRLAPMLEEHPGSLQLLANRINAECALGALGADTDALVLEALPVRPPGDKFVIGWLRSATSSAVAGTCPGLGIATLHAWLETAASAPALADPSYQANLADLRGELHLAEGDPTSARAAFDHALRTEPGPGRLLRQAAMLASAGETSLALGHLRAGRAAGLADAARPGLGMRRVHHALLQRTGFWQTELDALESLLVEETGQ